jgi:hypothetical protein
MPQTVQYPKRLLHSVNAANIGKRINETAVKKICLDANSVFGSQYQYNSNEETCCGVGRKTLALPWRGQSPPFYCNERGSYETAQLLIYMQSKVKVQQAKGTALLASSVFDRLRIL